MINMIFLNSKEGVELGQDKFQTMIVDMIKNVCQEYIYNLYKSKIGEFISIKLKQIKEEPALIRLDSQLKKQPESK